MSMLGDFIRRSCDVAFGLLNRLMNWLGYGWIETIETEELMTHRDQYVLVDVRSRDEQAVSIIAGAITAGDYEAAPEFFAGKTIVPYCTVGGRAYLYARKLAAAGVPTKNYRASILGWCQSHGPLETLAGEPTRAVHPHWPIYPFPDEYEVKS